MIYPCHGMLPRNIKEWTATDTYNLYESQGSCDEWKKAISKGYTLSDSIYVILSEIKMKISDCQWLKGVGGFGYKRAT